MEVPAGTGLTGPALVATGFPHTPEGAIGQLAQIDTAVLSSMSPQTAREVYSAWALPGGVAPEDWWTATAVDSFLTSSGMGGALAPDAAVTVEPAAALIKGNDGPDWTTVCVLMKVSATYRSEAQTGWGHCERMQWVGGRWMIAPGNRRPPPRPPGPAPGWPPRPAGRPGNHHLHQHRRRALTWSTASRSLRSRTVALIALALVTAAAVFMFTRPDTTDSGEPSASTQLNVQTGAVASRHGSTSTQESPQTSPKGGVVLPRGAEQVNGLATRFPYTDLGAVATQVAVSRAQIGFDYDTAATAVSTYAAPEETAVFEQRARVAVAERRKAAGVPADGEVPAPASYAVTPVAYHLLRARHRLLRGHAAVLHHLHDHRREVQGRLLRRHPAGEMGRDQSSG